MAEDLQDMSNEMGSGPVTGGLVGQWKQQPAGSCRATSYSAEDTLQGAVWSEMLAALSHKLQKCTERNVANPELSRK